MHIFNDIVRNISAHRSWFYRILCSGGIDPENPHNPIDNPEHGCMTWFRDYLATALNYRPVKAFIIMIFVSYLVGALYGLTTLQEGLERRKLSKEDSYSIAFYDRQDIYFREFPYRIQVSQKFFSKFARRCASLTILFLIILLRLTFDIVAFIIFNNLLRTITLTFNFNFDFYIQ